MKVKQRAEDIKKDKLDRRLLADLTRMNWPPIGYIPQASGSGG